MSGGSVLLATAGFAFGAMFAVGIPFESVGDRQLARCKANPAQRGRVIDRGLWRYPRHPRCCGDCVAWFPQRAPLPSHRPEDVR
ncbi:DUF1295 domain-containing protein [Myxococcota bacterium]|nr:DUF1295 domain-containing protein [Myxococcota bacterium]